MHYTRLDLRFEAGGWARGTLVAGAVAGPVRGVLVDPASRTVLQTLVPRSRRSAATLKAVGTDRTPTPPGAVRLSGRVLVHGPSGAYGQLAHLWCEREGGGITAVLLTSRRGPFGRRETRVLEARHIEGFSARGVEVRADAPPKADLPLFRVDAAIAQDVAAALESAVPDLRAQREIKQRVEDGHVHLSGVVETEEQVQRAQRAAAAVVGVRGVTSDLVSLETLAQRVEVALGSVLAAHALNGATIHVLTEHGIVYLEGSAPTTELRTALERAALTASGARVVVNNVAVGGDPPSRASGTGPLVRNR